MDHIYWNWVALQPLKATIVNNIQRHGKAKHIKAQANPAQLPILKKMINAKKGLG